MVKEFIYKRNPMILMVADPNGSGKNTVTKAYLRRSDLAETYVNADDIKIEPHGNAENGLT